ncbi:Sm-like protein [Martiniozyma asiatica (nom. inval.)]|nr:Sm-like protein [Martiniozyma asiatica]
MSGSPESQPQPQPSAPARPMQEKQEKQQKKNPRKPQREPILDLETLLDQPIVLTFIGGRALEGTLVGYDSLMNLVITDVKEIGKDERSWPKVVVKGSMLATIESEKGSIQVEPEALI